VICRIVAGKLCVSCCVYIDAVYCYRCLEADLPRLHRNDVTLSLAYIHVMCGSQCVQLTGLEEHEEQSEESGDDLFVGLPTGESLIVLSDEDEVRALGGPERRRTQTHLAINSRASTRIRLLSSKCITY